MYAMKKNLIDPNQNKLIAYMYAMKNNVNDPNQSKLI